MTNKSLSIRHPGHPPLAKGFDTQKSVNSHLTHKNLSTRHPPHPPLLAKGLDKRRPVKSNPAKSLAQNFSQPNTYRTCLPRKGKCRVEQRASSLAQLTKHSAQSCTCVDIGTCPIPTNAAKGPTDIHQHLAKLAPHSQKNNGPTRLC